MYTRKLGTSLDADDCCNDWLRPRRESRKPRAVDGCPRLTPRLADRSRSAKLSRRVGYDAELNRAVNCTRRPGSCNAPRTRHHHHAVPQCHLPSSTFNTAKQRQVGATTLTLSCPAHVEQVRSGLYSERSERAKHALARRVNCSKLLGLGHGQFCTSRLEILDAFFNLDTRTTHDFN